MEPLKPLIRKEITSDTSFHSLLWHADDCRCCFCERTQPTVCPWPDCSRVLPHPRYLAKHIRGHKRAERRRKYKEKQKNHAIKPDGYGLVKRVLASRFDINHLTRFSATLFHSAPGALKACHLKFSKASARRLAEIELNPETWFTQNVTLPGFVLATAYKIAEKARVSPNVALTALLTYGVQHLVEELRANPTKLPEPQLPIQHIRESNCRHKGNKLTDAPPNSSRYESKLADPPPNGGFFPSTED